MLPGLMSAQSVLRGSSPMKLDRGPVMPVLADIFSNSQERLFAYDVLPDTMAKGQTRL